MLQVYIYNELSMSNHNIFCIIVYTYSSCSAFNEAMSDML